MVPTADIQLDSFCGSIAIGMRIVKFFNLCHTLVKRYVIALHMLVIFGNVRRVRIPLTMHDKPCGIDAVGIDTEVALNAVIDQSFFAEVYKRPCSLTGNERGSFVSAPSNLQSDNCCIPFSGASERLSS